MTNPRPENLAKKADITSFDNYQKNLKHLLSGAISGFISRTCTAPLERIVILQQTRNPTYLNMSIPNIFINMIKQEGILSCFKGNGANLLRIIPFTSIELFSYEFYKYQFDSLFDNNAMSGSRNALYLLAGLAAGATAATVVYPLDLVRTLFAFQTNNAARSMGIIGTWTDIVRRQGFFALYRGLGATCMGISPYSSLKLATFQLLQNQFRGKNKEKPSGFINFLFGAISACVAITITYPTDLIRKRFQVKVLQKEVENLTYLSFTREIIAKEGFRGLYTGLTASYLRLIPIVGIALSVNEKLKDKWNI